MKRNLCYISHISSKTLETDISLYIWGICVLGNMVEHVKYLEEDRKLRHSQYFQLFVLEKNLLARRKID